ncbi:MAG: Fic family protein [Chloroflexota bacterium]
MFEPAYHISPRLLDAIKRIAVLIHELNKYHIPDIMYAELLSEALVTSTYASTSIEGNPLPLTEVKRLLKTQPNSIRESEREILNYNQTLKMLNDTMDSPFTLQQILDIHQGVVDGLLPKEHSGHWRQEPIVVYDPRTGNVAYLPPDHQSVPKLMTDLINFVQSQINQLDSLILAGIFHKQFVVMHPFVDGNGRTARLATKKLLAGLGVNLFHLLSFENYYNQNVTRYFQSIGVYGDYYELASTLDFTQWLEYFADGILDELYRLDKQLTARQRQPDYALQPHHQLILDLIDANGYVTDRAYGEQTTRAKATRSLDFKRLIEVGLIERKGRGRSTYYQRV